MLINNFSINDQNDLFIPLIENLFYIYFHYSYDEIDTKLYVSENDQINNKNEQFNMLSEFQKLSNDTRNKMKLVFLKYYKLLIHYFS